jgi:hypothetical protein
MCTGWATEALIADMLITIYVEEAEYAQPAQPNSIPSSVENGFRTKMGIG